MYREPGNLDSLELNGFTKIGTIEKRPKRGPIAEFRQAVGSFISGGRQVISEIIGRYTYTKPIWGARVLLNVDKVQTDYIFWDMLRRGKAKGYEIGGLFCMPIAQTIVSYVMGDGISAKLVSTAATEQKVNKLPISELGLPPGQATVPGQTATYQKPDFNNSTAKGLVGGKKTPNLPSNPNQQPAKFNASSGDPKVDYTNLLLSRFMKRHQSFFTQLFTDLYCLGDQYVIVNPDCSLSVASPETVTVEYATSDYKTPLRYIIRTKLERAIVMDVYTKEGRDVRIHYYDLSQPDVNMHFDNLIGRIPVIHFTNDRSQNEIYGRPIYEALLYLLSRYDDLWTKQIDGVELLANPIPTFSELDDIQETIAANTSQETYTDRDGNSQTRSLLRFDRLPALFLGKGGKFSFSSPSNGFTNDTRQTLDQMFNLMSKYSRIPVFMWGDAIGSSKASTESQVEPFLKYIQSRRLQLEGTGADELLGEQSRGGLQELLDVYLKMVRLINPSVVVAPIAMDWPVLSAMDDMIRFQWTQFLDATGKLDPATTVSLSGLVDDPNAIVAKAQGKDVVPQDFDDFNKKINQALLEKQKYAKQPGADQAVPDSILSSVNYDPNSLATANPSRLGENFSLGGPGLWGPNTIP